MNFFKFYIISSDTILRRKWEKAFLREDWKISSFDNISKFKIKYSGEKSLLFIEIGSNINIIPAELKKNFSNKNFSIITFADEKHITDSLIATFLESCCDDFILKSLDEQILVAKIKAHLRRLLPSTNYLKTVIHTKKGDIKIDINKKTVELGVKTKKAHCLENLTPKEFQIFSILICHEDDIVPRNVILEYIWKEKADTVNSETVDKHVESLRRKLGSHGKKIKTIYGSGYAFKNE
ncbi:MAG: response regulator transcription factor [Elusimicrobiales bacterium]|nr:response regulator transcription factor [Elusimicrobiales bacterium]